MYAKKTSSNNKKNSLKYTIGVKATDEHPENFTLVMSNPLRSRSKRSFDRQPGGTASQARRLHLILLFLAISLVLAFWSIVTLRFPTMTPLHDFYGHLNDHNQSKGENTTCAGKEKCRAAAHETKSSGTSRQHRRAEQEVVRKT